MKTNQLFLLTGLAAVTLPACVQKDKKGVSEKAHPFFGHNFCD